MISFKRLVFLGFAVALSSVILIVAGCDTADQSNNSSSGVSIAPDSVVVSALSVTNVAFTSSGGTAPYTWSVSNPSIGSVAGDDASAVYTAYALSGTNYVTVTDANSNAVSTTVTQE